MKISDSEKKLLLEYDLNATASLKDLAKATGFSLANTQKLKQRLLEKSILLGLTAQIDLAQLGLIEFAVNIGIASKSEQVRLQFTKFLSKESSVGWLAEVGADYDYMFNVIARMPQTVDAVLKKSASNFDGAILNKKLYIRLQRLRFQRGIFGAKTKNRIGIYTPLKNAKTSPIDELDYQILQKLSTSHLMSFREIALNLGTTPATFNRRVEELKARGVILGFYWHMNVVDYGVLHYRILISLTRNTNDIYLKIYKACCLFPAVKLLAQCLGEWDYELEIDVLAHSEIKPIVGFLGETLYSDLQKLSVIPIFRHVKFSSLPVN
jgi:DNA-binding Lrp family transcriptional regulator